MAGLPGKTPIRETESDFESAHAMVSSRPPEPSSKTVRTGLALSPLSHFCD